MSARQHEIRSGLGGEVVKVYKRDGRSGQAAEPLFRVANCGRLRVEGLCKVQQAGLLRVGMRALVEPELRGERLPELSGHRRGHAAGGRAGRPLVASASEDRTVMLWGWPGGRATPTAAPRRGVRRRLRPRGESSSDGFLLASGSCGRRAAAFLVFVCSR